MVSVKRGRIKRGARTKLRVEPECPLKEGDWLDVLDGDGVWNVARVLSVPSPDKVEITYDGWSKDYDEVVSIHSHRVAPYHTFTWTVKCWVKYLNWPLWPSVVTIRAPGTEAGINNLAIENRLFVDFLDNPDFAKRDRCWQKKAHVRPFGENYDRKRTGSTGVSFERALGWVLQSNASSKMPKFAAGTLPMEYKLIPAKSVETVRRDMEDELWFQNLIHNRTRHQMNHVYETIGCEEGKRSRKDSMPAILNDGLLNLSVMKVEPQLVSNERKRPAGIKVDQNLRTAMNMPQELESMHNSEDSDIDDPQNISQPKRKRLYTKKRSDGLSKARKAEREDVRRSVSPHVKKTPKSVAQLAVKNIRANHSKGWTKTAARRRLQPIGESITLNESATADNSECSAATKRTKWSRRNDSNQSFEREASIMLSMVDHHSADTKKKETGLGWGEHPSSVQPKVNKHRKGKTMETTMSISKHSKELRCSLDSATRIFSSDSDESKGISADNTARKKTIEKNESIQETDSNDSTCVEKHHLILLDADNPSAYDVGCSQELRRRFCVMQADQEDADASETVKCSKKTVISVPRKFKEISASQIPTCCSDSLAGFALPPRLRTLTSGIQAGAALAAPSTKVFSSSSGFSMESWFKRKLITDFMSGGT